MLEQNQIARDLHNVKVSRVVKLERLLAIVTILISERDGAKWFEYWQLLRETAAACES